MRVLYFNYFEMSETDNDGLNKKGNWKIEREDKHVPLLIRTNKKWYVPIKIDTY